MEAVDVEHFDIEHAGERRHMVSEDEENFEHEIHHRRHILHKSTKTEG